MIKRWTIKIRLMLDGILIVWSKQDLGSIPGWSKKMAKFPFSQVSWCASNWSHGLRVLPRIHSGIPLSGGRKELIDCGEWESRLLSYLLENFSTTLSWDYDKIQPKNPEYVVLRFMCATVPLVPTCVTPRSSVLVPFLVPFSMAAQKEHDIIGSVQDGFMSVFSASCFVWLTCSKLLGFAFSSTPQTP